MIKPEDIPNAEEDQQPQETVDAPDTHVSILSIYYNQYIDVRVREATSSVQEKGLFRYMRDKIHSSTIWFISVCVYLYGWLQIKYDTYYGGRGVVPDVDEPIVYKVGKLWGRDLTDGERSFSWSKDWGIDGISIRNDSFMGWYTQTVHPHDVVYYIYLRHHGTTGLIVIPARDLPDDPQDFFILDPSKKCLSAVLVEGDDDDAIMNTINLYSVTGNDTLRAKDLITLEGRFLLNAKDILRYVNSEVVTVECNPNSVCTW